MSTDLAMAPNLLSAHFRSTAACPLCGSAKVRQFLRLDGLKFDECSQCRFRFMNPYLTDEGMGILYENSETLAGVNPALGGYYEYDSALGENRTRKDYLRVLALASKHVAPSSGKRRLFEVGYGTGQFLLEAFRAGWAVDGIDTSEENCKRLVQERGITVRRGTFQDFDPPKGHYHLIALWDVIEHTIDPRSFVKKAWDMLVPGGLLVMATPNIGGLLNRVSEFLYRLSFGKAVFAVKQLYVTEHVGYFSGPTLRRLVREEGFLLKEEFLSETDLERYQFSPGLKVALKVFFFVARLCRMQNRIIIAAQKPLAP